jgi:transposase
MVRIMPDQTSSLLKKPSQRPTVDDSIIYHESSGARMRGAFADQGGLFSYISPEARVPAGHPLRKIRALVRDVLGELNRSLGKLYASEGRPSIPPGQLLSALLLQVFYGIRSERQLMEQLDYNLLYRWFVGLSPDDLVWDPTTFTKNRDRLQNGEVFAKFMSKLLNHPQVKPLLSDEHFSVDGTLIEAWASQKSFRPKDGSGDDDGANFHGQKRKNDTHRVPATRTAGFIAKRPDGRPSFAISATPPWRTGMGWRWPAGSRMPMAPPNAGFGDHAEGETQSRRSSHHGR